MKFLPATGYVIKMDLTSEVLGMRRLDNCYFSPAEQHELRAGEIVVKGDLIYTMSCIQEDIKSEGL